MDRLRIAALAVASWGLICLGTPGDGLAAQGAPSARTHGAPPSDLSAQQRVPSRSRTRIVVHPRPIYPRGPIGPPGFGLDLYPRPYPYDWPGPNTQRECIGWLAADARPSGTVVVPRRRCWWVSRWSWGGQRPTRPC